MARKCENIVKPYLIIKIGKKKFSSSQGVLGEESEIGEQGRYEKGEASYLFFKNIARQENSWMEWENKEKLFDTFER